MNTKSITVPTSIANNVAILVRSSILTMFSSWRPFAYTYTNDANLLSAGGSFIESPCAIHSAFSNLDYSSFGKAEENNVIEKIYTVSKGNILLTSDIVQTAPSSIPIATAQEDTTLTVHFLYSSGLSSDKRNRTFIGESKQSVVFATRHTIVEDIGFTISDNGNNQSTIIFSNVTDELLQQVFNIISNLFK